ncbi:MAG: 3-methyl-2-oxobutanoate dehydrogenase subunit VorB [Defluviitaleaceae bacterium]|nr:3-methyl-2-oxobutanoate dehydrogenase subunit VorB [Defluviitaleaceae bacterium]
MKMLMKGNEAICEAAIVAGCKAFFGYPITPQNEIPEYMSLHMVKAGGAYVQAESEIGAINMCYGAAASGVRVMTSSSSPGIALKQEGMSYLAGANLPCVVVNVSRSGPGLGGILPAQGDYFQMTRGGGNGDYYTPVYAPFSVQEAVDLIFKAFDVADKYRTPVQMVADGMLGQMMEPCVIEPRPAVKVDKSWVTDGNSGKRPRNIVNSLNLSAEGLEQMNIQRFAQYKEIEKNETLVDYRVNDGDEIVIVAYGAPARVAVNAVDELNESGIKAGLIRPVTLWPYPYASFQNLPASVKHILVCELSMGQMIDDVKIAVAGKYPVHFYGRCGGVIFEPSEIVEAATKIVKGGA